LNFDRHYGAVCARPGIKGAIHAAIWKKPGNPVDIAAVDRGEFARDQHHAIGLHGQGIDGCSRTAHSGAGIETGVQTSIGVEPRNAEAVRAIDGIKLSPDQHLAIRLKGDGKDFRRDTADALSRVETQVERAIRVDPDDIRAFNPIVRVEDASNDNLVIRLDGQCVVRIRGLVPERNRRLDLRPRLR
jgi:hypothetical protein